MVVNFTTQEAQVAGCAKNGSEMADPTEEGKTTNGEVQTWQQVLLKLRVYTHSPPLTINKQDP